VQAVKRGGSGEAGVGCLFAILEAHYQIRRPQTEEP